MKKNTLKSSLFLVFTIFSLFLGAQTTAPDEDTGAYTTCNPEGANATRTSDDLPNPVNVGTIDDRSCYANYKESTINTTVWGIYNITEGSNNQDTNGLQPRIERSLTRSQTTGVGSYARFTGTVRILEVGKTSSFGNDGTYMMQAKGRHTGGGGSPDPAICLFLARPVYGPDGNGNQVQVSFDVYREQINFRGGSGGSGRQEVFLINIQKNVPTDIELEVGFREDPNNASKKIHYADAVIAGQAFNFNIPEPERGLESGIRYGAYRIKGGRGQIRWANTTYEKVDKVNDGNPPDPTQEVFSMKNVATGKFLTDSGVSAMPVTMSDSDGGQNTHWTFVESGAFFNIDSETYGILRAPGSSGPGGAYVVVSTASTSPSVDSDKVWTIYYNESDDTYRYESGNSGRFLYHEANGNVTHIVATNTDDRSKWQAISKSALSVSDAAFRSPSIKIYPNPAEDDFTIKFENIVEADVKIYNMLGKLVFEGSTTKGSIQIRNQKSFVSGLYLVKALANDSKVFKAKLVIK